MLPAGWELDSVMGLPQMMGGVNVSLPLAVILTKADRTQMYVLVRGTKTAFEWNIGRSDGG